MAGARGTPLPPAHDDLAEIARQYGITVTGEGPTAAPGRGKKKEESDDDIIKSFGVTVPKDTAPKEPKRVKTETYTRPNAAGKITENPPQADRSPETKMRAQERGFLGEAAGAVPIVGPLIDIGTAAARARGTGRAVGDEMTKIKDASALYGENNPFGAVLANLMGSAVGYGGLAKAAPTAMGLVGPMGARIWTGGLGGGGLGGADAALRMDNPIEGAKVGAIGGVLGPLMGQGARSGTRMVAEHAFPRPGPLAHLPRPEINTLVRGMEGETPASIAQARKEVGPAGFLADLNQSLTDIVGAISDAPGAAKGLVRDAYRHRQDMSPHRIASALDRAMGPNFNVVDHERFLTEARKAAADPLYEQWRTMTVHPTKELMALTPRLEAAGAFDLAEELAKISGKPMNRSFFGNNKIGPTTETWDMAKQGLDRAIDLAYKNGDKKKAAALIELKSDMLREIEKTPAGQVWKQARGEFADRSALIDQTNAGRDTFAGGRSALSVDELREELRHLSAPELMARINGLRAAAGEAMAEGADASLRKKMLTPSGQEKIRLLLRDQRQADDLIDSLKSENVLAAKFPQVVPNANTGASNVDRQNRQSLLTGRKVPNMELDLSKPLSIIPQSWRPGSALQALFDERAAKQGPNLAPTLLTPNSSPKMDDLIAAIFQESARLNKVDRTSGPWANALSGLVTGPGSAEYRRGIAQDEHREKMKKRKRRGD